MKRVLVISAEQFEDTELLVPYYRLREAGMEVTVASLKKAPITGKHGYRVDVDIAVEDVEPRDYDALVLPGGKAPAALRKDEKVLEAARHFFEAKKPVAAICHGPQVLISAGLMKGRRATCYGSVKGELEKSGARYEDREVVVDENLVTSRQPSDLPAFMRETMRKLEG